MATRNSAENLHLTVQSHHCLPGRYLDWVVALCECHDVQPQRFLDELRPGDSSSLSWMRFAEILADVGRYFSPEELSKVQIDFSLTSIDEAHLAPYQPTEIFLGFFGPNGLIGDCLPIKSHFIEHTDVVPATIQGDQFYDGSALQLSLHEDYQDNSVLFEFIHAQMRSLAALSRGYHVAMASRDARSAVFYLYRDDGVIASGLRQMRRQLDKMRSNYVRFDLWIAEVRKKERQTVELLSTQYELVKANATINQARATLDEMSQLTSSMSWFVKDNNIIRVAPSIAAQLGYSQTEFCSFAPDEIAIPEHKTRYNDLTQRLDGATESVCHEQMDLTHRLEGKITVVLYAKAMVDTDGSPLVWFMAVKVASELSVRDQLSQQEHGFQAITNVSMEAIITFDQHYTIVYANPAAVRIFGFTATELPGKSIKSLLPESLGGQPLREIYRQQLGTPIVNLPVTGLTRSRKLVPLEVSFASGNQKGDHDTTCLIRDLSRISEQIAEKRFLQNQVQASQKMQAVGQLTSGVVHDFNNLLVAISGFADLAAETGGPERSSHLAEIKLAARRGKAMTEHLLDFSGQRSAIRESLIVNDALSRLTPFIARLLPANVSVTLALASEDAVIDADRTQIEQIIMNLAVNARDAMPDGGALTIGTSNTSESVILSITDTGSGMTEEVRAKLFEAFFTTKPEGQGTGLGLSVVSDIVTLHGGHIEVDSAPGEGTRFLIHLPRQHGAASAHGVSQAIPDQTHLTASKHENQTSRSNGETLLLIEEDPQVKQVIDLVLKGAGYQIVTAENAEQALDILERDRSSHFSNRNANPEHHASDIDAVILNTFLRSRSSFDLVNAMLKLNPSLQIIFSSGYPEDHPEIRKVRARGFPLIQKPFNTRQLRRDIREILDQSDIKQISL